MKLAVRSSAFAIGLAFARIASADPGDPAAVDQPTTDEASRHAIDRTWLYTDDARVAAPLTAVATTSVSYARAGTGFASNIGQPGGAVSAGGEVGLLPRVSVMALGQMGFGGEATGPNAGAIAGVRVQLLPSSWTRTHLVASAGYLREAWSPGQPSGDNGAWFRASFSGDVQRFRLATTVHGEHVFANGRDGADVMVQAGASYRVLGGFRAGVEYVGQDLEELAEGGREGGARHFLGPVASMQLMDDRLTMVAGPSFGLSEISPRVLGRVAIAYGF